MKLKYSIIEKLNTLSVKEHDLLSFVIKCQEEETGQAEGTYYREAMYQGYVKLVRKAFKSKAYPRPSAFRVGG